MDNNFVIVLSYCVCIYVFTYIIMSHNRKIPKFYLPYFHISNICFAKYSGTLLLHRRSLHAFYHHNRQQRLLSSELLGVFCEFKSWFMFCLCHYSAINNVMIYWIALQRSLTVYEHLPSFHHLFVPYLWDNWFLKTNPAAKKAMKLHDLSQMMAKMAHCFRDLYIKDISDEHSVVYRNHDLIGFESGYVGITKTIFRHPTISLTHSTLKISEHCDLTHHG